MLYAKNTTESKPEKIPALRAYILDKNTDNKSINTSVCTIMPGRDGIYQENQIRRWRIAEMSH